MDIRNPTFSIITACLNPGESLIKCIDSVQNQGSSDYEHIIIDGGSTDGTIDRLRATKAPQLRWISEKDKGIAHAMNKGILLAKGEWLLFLHSDDWLSGSDSLDIAHRALPAFPAILSSPVKQYHTDQSTSIIPNLGWCLKTRFKITLGHQGAFIHRDLFKQLGAYDESFQITMDYEWFLRAYHAEVPIIRLESILSEMSATGLSSRTDWPSLRMRFSEERRAHRLHTNGSSQRISYALYWSLYPAYRFIVYRLKN